MARVALAPTSFYDEFSNISGSWQMLQGANVDAFPAQYNNPTLSFRCCNRPEVVTVRMESSSKDIFTTPWKRPQLKRATKIRLDRGLKNYRSTTCPHDAFTHQGGCEQ